MTTMNQVPVAEESGNLISFLQKVKIAKDANCDMRSAVGAEQAVSRNMMAVTIKQ